VKLRSFPGLCFPGIKLLPSFVLGGNNSPVATKLGDITDAEDPRLIRTHWKRLRDLSPPGVTVEKMLQAGEQEKVGRSFQGKASDRERSDDLHLP